MAANLLAAIAAGLGTGAASLGSDVLRSRGLFKTTAQDKARAEELAALQRGAADPIHEEAAAASRASLETQTRAHNDALLARIAHEMSRGNGSASAELALSLQEGANKAAEQQENALRQQGVAFQLRNQERLRQLLAEDDAQVRAKAQARGEIAANAATAGLGGFAQGLGAGPDPSSVARIIAGLGVDPERAAFMASNPGKEDIFFRAIAPTEEEIKVSR